MARLGTPPAPYTAMIQRFSRLSSSSLARFAAPVLLGLVVSAGVAEAQRRPVPVKSQQTVTEKQRRESIILPGFYPPAGMCRIWINDVPPGQQPAPTDCASAVRNRPANGKVLFGDPPKGKKGKTNKSKSSPTDGLVDLITRGISR